MRKFGFAWLIGLAFPLSLVLAAPALAALAEVGPVIGPYGYPQYYGDANGLRLQLCQDGDGVSGLCIFDPINPDNPDSVALGVGDESFWWMAVAEINEDTVPDPQGIDAELTLALEGAFGGIGVARDGDQIAFGRIRIRIDTPAEGTYTVTHPYGVEVFEDVPADRRAINVTFDIGAINVLNPAEGFAGALRTQIGPFLTWPDYLLEPTLKVPVLGEGGLPTGEFIQYIGNPQIPHTVTGSPFTEPGEPGPANYFRVQGPNGIDVRIDLFEVMGKVLPEPPPAAALHVFPPPPPANLFALGPVNRAVPFATPTSGTVTGFEVPGYPVGFPLWYQENVGTQEEPVGGLRLALCPPANLDPMCISEALNATDPVSQRLGVGGEAFWWSAAAFINEDTLVEGELPNGLDGELTLALEAAFALDQVADGDQIAFGRVRVRVDVPTDGDYTITHPYGVEVVEDVTTEDGINFTRDLGVIDPRDPDGSFIGGLYSDIGPTFLTWPDYQLEESLQVDGRQYVGDPAEPHAVVGSPFTPEGESEPANYFRIEGPGGIDVLTRMFTVSGKVFDPASLPVQACLFRTGPQLARWLIDNGNGVWEPAIDVTQRFGRAGDFPVAGDWNGDGRKQLGVFRDDGQWILDDGDGVITAADLVLKFGRTGDLPVTGDWNGDGTTEVGLFRGDGQWVLDSNGDGAYAAGIDRVSRFGRLGDIPVTGDWNGDGTTEVGVFRGDGQWVLDMNGDGVFTAGIDRVVKYGRTGDIPVTGDWNHDGITEVGLFRAGQWILDSNGDGRYNAGIDQVFRFGQTGDVPLLCGDGGGEFGNRGGVEIPVDQPVAEIQFQTILPAALLTDGFSAALAINTGGLAVGVAEDTDGTLKGVRWQAETPTRLDPLAGFDYSAAYAVNDNGVVVGESENGPFVTAAYWPAGATTAAPLSIAGLFAGNSSAYAINGSGGIVGEGAGDAAGSSVAVYWGSSAATPAILPDLALPGLSSAYDLSENGAIVGSSLNNSGEIQAVLWQPGAGGAYGAPLPLPKLTATQLSSVAWGIDESGRIVGEAQLTDGSVHGVVWLLTPAGTGIFLTSDLGAGTSIQAINSKNRIVGSKQPGSGSDVAVIWNGADFGDHQELAAPFSQAYGINSGSRVVGIAGHQAFIAVTP